MAALSLTRISRGLTLAGKWGLDWLIPPQCLACRDEVAEASGLCVHCWAKLAFIEPPFCDRLAIPFPYDQGQGALSAAALADPPDWDRARAALLFDDAAQGLAHALKYRDRHEAGLLMARLMRRAGADILGGADGIIPVPLHRFRLWRRRYNQSAILARHIARDSRTAFCPELLQRRRATRSQTGLDREERQRNVRDAFIVPEAARPLVVGKSFVLVDDVRTTGATLAASAKALKGAGAARVDVLTFALVHKPRQLHI
ncbi:MAG: ComF family protein [Parvibaculaceae bacterium]